MRAALAALGPLGQAGMPLAPLTTYKVGGPAAVGAVVRREADLAAVAAAHAASGLPLLVVGRGSNLLVADAGFPGLAVLLDPAAFGALGVSWAADGSSAQVRAGAALPLPALARRTVEAGLTGLEWAVGVPGSVGGGVRMNAGGHGSDVAASLVSAEVVDLADPAPQARRLGVAELGLGYRRSALQASQVVVAAELVARRGDPVEGRGSIRDIVRWRREHQPGGHNAGSVFVNPVSRSPSLSAAEGPDLPSAGRLIDAAGLRGRRRGSASVSTKHANFIQADPGGSAGDVLALIEEVRAEVAARTGIVLRTEIRLVGFPGRPEETDLAQA